MKTKANTRYEIRLANAVSAPYRQYVSFNEFTEKENKFGFQFKRSKISYWIFFSTIINETMKDIFENLSKEENGNLEITYEKSYSQFVMSPLTRKENGSQIKALKLDIEYKNHIIKIENRLSNIQLGSIGCKMENHSRFSNFEITHRSHFWRIFNKKHNILKVDCTKKEFKKMLSNSLSELENIARKSQFEPLIVGEKKDNIYELDTTYYLGFSEKKNVLRPIVDFYKKLIDIK